MARPFFVFFVGIAKFKSASIGSKEYVLSALKKSHFFLHSRGLKKMFLFVENFPIDSSRKMAKKYFQSKNSGV